jgi:hypothetical protein
MMRALLPAGYHTEKMKVGVLKTETPVEEEAITLLFFLKLCLPFCGGEI